MFDNIGEKIKLLAKITCKVGIIASVLTGVVFCFTLEIFLVFLGFIIMICGSLLFWISSIFVYGFGELIDDNKETRKNLNYINLKLSQIPNKIFDVDISEVSHQPVVEKNLMLLSAKQ